MKSILTVIYLLLCSSQLLSGDEVAENILLHQRDTGGWPKNYDWERELTDGEKKNLRAKKKKNDTSFDNGATHTEVRYLAKAFLKSGDPRYREAALKGIEFMLSAQYENGGWPQTHPNPSGYSAHVTFNDGAMIGVMSVLRDIAQEKKAYPFVSDELRKHCGEFIATLTKITFQPGHIGRELFRRFLRRAEKINGCIAGCNFLAAFSW